MNQQEKEVLAATVMVIDSFYQWIKQIEDAGGATSLEGVAKCHAFLKSMRKNEKRLKEMVLTPAINLIQKDVQVS